MKNRNCFVCNRPIEECMGFVIARDILSDQFTTKRIPRELCGICGFKALFFPESFFTKIEESQAS